MTEKKISWITDEVGMKTLNYILLAMFTGGIYHFIWITERFNIFNSLSQSVVISKKIINIAAILIGLNIMLASSGLAGLVLLGTVLNLAGWIVLVMVTFKIIKAMKLYYAENFKVDLKFNKVWMILFNLLYINYCINELKDIEIKNNSLNS